MLDARSSNLARLAPDPRACSVHLFGRAPASVETEPPEENQSVIERMTQTVWTAEGPAPTSTDERMAELASIGLLERANLPGMLREIWKSFQGRGMFDLPTVDAVRDATARWIVGAERRRDHVLVTSTCVAFSRAQVGGATVPPIAATYGMPDPKRLDDFDPGRGNIGIVSPATTIPWIKIRVNSSQWPGPVVMDVDREIIVPARGACIEAIAEPPSATFPGWFDVGQLGSNPTQLGGQVWDVYLFLKVCPEQNFPSPVPIVSEHVQLASGTYTFTRPRGARSLFISAQVGAQTWLMFSGRAGVAMGTIVVPAGEVGVFHTLPGFTHLVSPNGAAVHTVAWQVQP